MFAVAGLKEAKEKLRQMAEKTVKQFIRKAEREALKPMLATARAGATERTGRMRRSIKIKGGRGSKTKIVVRIVIDAKAYVGAPYGMFVNEGHFTGKRPAGLKGSAVKLRSLSATSGRRFIAGKHFMQQAFESKRATAVEIFVTKLTDSIQAELR